MIDLARKLNFDPFNYDMWSTVSSTKLIDYGGRGLLAHYEQSMHALLSSIFPEHPWVKKEVRPPNYWSSIENQRKFMETLGEKLGIKKGDYDAWYRIQAKQIMDNGGISLIKDHYNGSLLRMMKTIYPEHEWLPWKFEKVGGEFWKSMSNRRAFMLSLGKTLGISNNPEEFPRWYKVSNQDIIEHGGRTLIMSHYNWNMLKLFQEVFPEYPWKERKFVVSKKFWESEENQRDFFLDLHKRFGFRIGDYSRWYKVTTQSLLDSGARPILKRYNNSLFDLFCGVFPEIEWLPWKFRRLPRYYWSEVENVKAFMEYVRKWLEFSPEEREKWYGVSISRIRSIGGSGGKRLVVQYYGGSLKDLLSDVYPDYNWLPWRFRKSVTTFFQTFENHVEMMEHLRKKLGIAEGDYESYYQMDKLALESIGGEDLLKNYYNGDLYRMFCKVYPEYSWEQSRFPKTKRSRKKSIK